MPILHWLTVCIIKKVCVLLHLAQTISTINQKKYDDGDNDDGGGDDCDGGDDCGGDDGHNDGGD